MPTLILSPPRSQAARASKASFASRPLRGPLLLTPAQIGAPDTAATRDLFA
jgi:hypothetical protein